MRSRKPRTKLSALLIHCFWGPPGEVGRGCFPEEPKHLCPVGPSGVLPISWLPPSHHLGLESKVISSKRPCLTPYLAWVTPHPPLCTTLPHSIVFHVFAAFNHNLQLPLYLLSGYPHWEKLSSCPPWSPLHPDSWGCCLNCTHCWWGAEMKEADLPKMQMHSPFDLVFPLLGIYSTNSIAQVQ